MATLTETELDVSPWQVPESAQKLNEHMTTLRAEVLNYLALRFASPAQERIFMHQNPIAPEPMTPPCTAHRSEHWLTGSQWANAAGDVDLPVGEVGRIMGVTIIKSEKVLDAIEEELGYRPESVLVQPPSEGMVEFELRNEVPEHLEETALNPEQLDAMRQAFADDLDALARNSFVSAWRYPMRPEYEMAVETGNVLELSTPVVTTL
jgi:hypothetical protein